MKEDMEFELIQKELADAFKYISFFSFLNIICVAIWVYYTETCTCTFASACTCSRTFSCTQPLKLSI